MPIDDFIHRVRAFIDAGGEIEGREPVNGIDDDPPWEDFGCFEPRPPLSEQAMSAAEERFGYRLPESLRAMYTHIGNGGFGPDYGLLPLVVAKSTGDSESALSQYFALSVPDFEDPYWRWPAGLLPVVSLGCGMYFCVDCSKPEGPITWFEPNPHVDGESWDDAIFPSTVTFEQLMQTWMRGENRLKLVAESHEALQRG